MSKIDSVKYNLECNIHEAKAGNVVQTPSSTVKRFEYILKSHTRHTACHPKNEHLCVYCCSRKNKKKGMLYKVQLRGSRFIRPQFKREERDRFSTEMKIGVYHFRKKCQKHCTALMHSQQVL